MKVVVLENDAGGITFYHAEEVEWAGKNYSSLELYLEYVEKNLNDQGVVTHGVIEESNVPTPPEGGIRNDLFWDGSGLAYGDTQLKASLLGKRDSLIESSNIDLVLAMEKYRYDDGTDNYRLIAQDPYLSMWKTYRDALRRLDGAIEVDPYAVVFPDAPVVAEVTLSNYKQNKISELQMAFNDELAAGAVSRALSADHRYDLDQHNINWIIACTLLTLTSAETPLISCNDLLGNENSKLPTAHNESQCSELLSDCMTVIQGIKDKLAGFETDVDNAADEAAVDAVVWA